MWKSTVKPDRPQITIERMRFACWITTATDTHRKYVIFIAFARQQSICECASMLRETYIACLSRNDFARRKTIQRR
jgi:hypothetical protein